MLSLSKLKPFEKGTKRSCYVHPDDPNLCVKVISGQSYDRNKLVEQRLEIEDFALLKQRDEPVLFERFPKMQESLALTLAKESSTNYYVTSTDKYHAISGS